MKILMPSIIDSVTASSSNSEYPISCVLNEYPKDIWKSATTGVVTIEVSLSEFDNCISVIDSNVPGDNGISWEIQNSSGQALENGTIYERTTRAGGSLYWIEFTNNAAQSKAVLSFINSNIHQMGCIQAGIVYTFSDPKKGLNKTYIDYSIRKKLASGSEYVKQKDRVDVYSGNFRDGDLDSVSGDSNFVEIAKGLSPDPLSMQVLHKSYVKTIFGKLEASNTFGGVYEGDVSFTIQEVV